MWNLLPFIFFSFALLSLWVRRDPKIWGILLAISFADALITGILDWVALIVILGWAALWVGYDKRDKIFTRIALVASLTVLSFGFKFHLYPGFHSLHLGSRFYLGLDSPLVGFFPLALLVPLSATRKEWKEALFKGLWLIVIGIGAMAIAAVMSGAVRWEFKIPSFPAERYLGNLILTAIPEEGFYRGFLQKQLCVFFRNGTKGKCAALLISSSVFTLAHLYWSPDLATFGFVFIAGLLYGGVYLLTDRIESSILCHFLLNFIHMTFFSYHAT